MDFLEIRRKAKERAGRAPQQGPAEGAAAAVAPPPEPSRDPEPAREPLPTFPHVEPEAAAPPAPAADAAFVDALRRELTAPARPPPPLPERAPVLARTPRPDAAALPAPVAAAPPPRAEPVPVAVRERDPLAEFFFDDAEEAPALAGVGPEAARPPERPEAVEARREYLTFLLGDEEYAVEIERVREVLKAPAITEVPRAPAHVLGVIMVRGEIIAVFDPRRRLGLPVGASARGRVLVCDAGEGPIGLLVDAVSQVVRLRPSDVEPRPQGIGGVTADYIAGIGREGDKMFILLDLAAVLRGAPAKEARA